MRTIRLRLSRSGRDHGHIVFYGAVEVLHDDAWEVGGVFSLREDEWYQLRDIFQAQGAAVEYEAAVQAD